MKNKINRVKKVTAILLAAVILVFAVPIAASAAEASRKAGASSGTTGDCAWTLDDDGTLTISGNGYMRDYTSTEHPPWGRQDIKKVIIENGVQNVGKLAFNNCENLTSATIADSVKYLYDGVFNNTKWYNDLPDGIVYAGKVAYIYKGELPANKSIIIKRGTQIINSRALKNLTDLACVTVPDSVTEDDPYWALPSEPALIYIFKGSYMPRYAQLNNVVLIDHSEIGDVNLDGIVDVRDVTVIQRHVAEYELITGEPLAFTDTDNDGNVTVADATLLQRYIAEYDVQII